MAFPTGWTDCLKEVHIAITLTIGLIFLQNDIELYKYKSFKEQIPFVS
jgi:hypothetical protein